MSKLAPARMAVITLSAANCSTPARPGSRNKKMIEKRNMKKNLKRGGAEFLRYNYLVQKRLNKKAPRFFRRGTRL
jgi:predicted secreted protein